MIIFCLKLSMLFIPASVCLTSTAQTVYESDKKEGNPVIAALFVPHKTHSEQQSVSQIEWQRKSQLYFITDKQVKFKSHCCSKNSFATIDYILVFNSSIRKPKFGSLSPIYGAVRRSAVDRILPFPLLHMCESYFRFF